MILTAKIDLPINNENLEKAEYIANKYNKSNKATFTSKEIISSAFDLFFEPIKITDTEEELNEKLKGALSDIQLRLGVF